jgi:cholesterol oxidase
VYLGDPTKEVDPYFNGLGPARKGCIECAGCMVGCRHNAKNTLDKNYLWLAEKHFGGKIIAETLVDKIIPIDDGKGGYKIHTRSSTGLFNKMVMEFTTKGVIMSGGVLGTLDLLLKQKYVLKTLPNISDKLGENILTNSEMLSGVVAADRKLNHGLAISSVFNPDDHTHIELCKFPDGSGAMLRLATMAAGDGKPVVRTAKMVGNVIAHPWDFLRSLFNTNAARNSLVFLIMQALPNSMTMKIRKGLFSWKLSFDNQNHEKVPSYIPIGQEALHRYSKKVKGVAHNAASELLLGLPSTAHILGGCPMGKKIEEGVVDEKFRMHGYPNFFILDGSIVPCNLGVNPSLTITALSEYAMAHIPKKEGTEGKSLEELMLARLEPNPHRSNIVP